MGNLGQGKYPKFGWKGWGRRKPTMSLKRGKIGPRLLHITNRKSHTRFWLVPKSTTLDELEGPLKHMRLSEPTTKFWMKIDPYYQRWRCSPMTVASGNMNYFDYVLAVKCHSVILLQTTKFWIWRFLCLLHCSAPLVIIIQCAAKK